MWPTGFHAETSNQTRGRDPTGEASLKPGKPWLCIGVWLGEFGVVQRA